MQKYVFGKISSLMHYRSVIRSLVRYNLVGHYKNSFLGFMWNFINPIVMLSVYYIVFTQLRGAEIDNFAIYLSTGIFPFYFMLNNLSSGSTCLISKSALIKKIYFPRELVVLSQVLSTFIIMSIGTCVSIVLSMLVGHSIDAACLLMLPIAMGINVVFVTGYVFLFSSITVYFRDLGHLISSTSIVLMFISPMYFLKDSFDGIAQIIVNLNPLTHFLELYHSLLYYGSIPTAFNIMLCVMLSFISFFVGYAVFKKLEKRFVDFL